MDYNGIIQAISTVGFPIAACCAMFYLYNNIIRDLTNTLAGITATLTGMDKTMDKICDKLNVDNDK